MVDGETITDGGAEAFMGVTPSGAKIVAAVRGSAEAQLSTPLPGGPRIGSRCELLLRERSDYYCARRIGYQKVRGTAVIG